MILRDPRQLRDPQRIAELAAQTHIRWEKAIFRAVHHGYLTPGGDHLLTVARNDDNTWTVHPDPDAVFDLGHSAEKLTVEGRFTTGEHAMRAAEDELASLLRRLTSTL